MKRYQGQDVYNNNRYLCTQVGKEDGGIEPRIQYIDDGRQQDRGEREEDRGQGKGEGERVGI